MSRDRRSATPSARDTARDIARDIARARGSRRARSLHAALATVLPCVLSLGLLLGLRPAPAGAQDEPRWSFPVQASEERFDVAPESPALHVDEAGGLHAAWVEDRHGTGIQEVYYAYRPPYAERFEPALRVAGGDGVPRDAPDVTVSTSGGLHLVWVERRGRWTEVVHGHRPGGARAWAPVERIDPTWARIGQGAPRIAADHWGNVHVLWVDHRNGGPDVFHARRTPAGAWGAAQPINQPLEGDQRAPELAVSAEGELHAVWEDSRDGRSRIQASRLPPGSQYWWPNAALVAEGASGRHVRPRVGVTAEGRVLAAWVEETRGEIRGSRLEPGEPFWRPDVALYRPERGAPLDVALAGGPGGLAVLAWRESRETPEGARLYAAAVLTDALGTATRVDGAPVVSQAGPPRLGVDADARAHLLWSARGREGWRGIYQTQAAYPLAPRPGERMEGWLRYQPRGASCQRDGYELVSCEGEVLRFFVPGPGIDPVPFLGSYVAVTGGRIEVDGCRRLLAGGLVFSSAPCAGIQGGVTGVVRDQDGPIEGALVHIGERAARSGTSGRYFVGGLAPGEHYVTATLDCALPIEGGLLALRPNQLLQLVPTTFVRGEVLKSCSIDIADLVRVASLYRTRPPYDPPCADVDADGVIGVADLSVVAGRLGIACPIPWLLPGGQPAVDPAEPVGASSDSAPPRPAAAVRGAALVARGDAPRGWSLLLAWDADAPPADADPTRAGVQPFPAPEDPSLLVLENRWDAASRRLRYAAVRVGPPPFTAPGLAPRLAWLPSPRSAPAGGPQPVGAPGGANLDDDGAERRLALRDGRPPALARRPPWRLLGAELVADDGRAARAAVGLAPARTGRAAVPTR